MIWIRIYTHQHHLIGPCLGLGIFFLISLQMGRGYCFATWLLEILWVGVYFWCRGLLAGQCNQRENPYLRKPHPIQLSNSISNG